jgi:hypothetical protein
MTFKCNRCGKTFPGFSGHAVRCPKCHQGTLVPAFHHAGGGAPPATRASPVPEGQDSPASTAVATEGVGGAPHAAVHPHRVKRPLAVTRAEPQGRLSPQLRTIFTLGGIVGACFLAIGILIIYPYLFRNTGDEGSKKASTAPAGKVDPTAGAGEKAAPPKSADKKETPPPPAADDEKKETGEEPADEKEAAPAEEEKAPAEEKAPEEEPKEAEEPAPEEKAAPAEEDEKSE